MEEVMKGCKVDQENTININENLKCNGDATLKDSVESTKIKMTGVIEENKRLKSMLQTIENDYKTLQMKIIDIVQRKSNNQNNESPGDVFANNVDQEQELVSLRLGSNRVPTKTKKDNITAPSKITCEEDDVTELGLGRSPERLKSTDDGPVTLGKNQGPDSYNQGKKKEGDQKSIPSKVLKTQRGGGDEEYCQTSVKRARVCVRAKCDTPTMNDGCQWRKYGQKIAKGNPCPRAYYRCTVSPTCPVRKQVQRCLNDKTILITTYEGTHNHPLPISATAMASTTSAAASMALSGSTTSPPSAAASSPFNLYRPPANWPNFSGTAPFSTVTLDLTTNPAASHGGFSLYPSSSQPNLRAPTTSLSFSSMECNMVPSIWGGGGFSNYDNFQTCNFVPGKSSQEQKYLAALEKLDQASSQQTLTETLTKAITSDPSFRSVIAAMVSTMAANGGVGKSEQ